MNIIWGTRIKRVHKFIHKIQQTSNLNNIVFINSIHRCGRISNVKKKKQKLWNYYAILTYPTWVNSLFCIFIRIPECKSCKWKYINRHVNYAISKTQHPETRRGWVKWMTFQLLRILLFLFSLHKNTYFPPKMCLICCVSKALHICEKYINW